MMRALCLAVALQLAAPMVAHATTATTVTSTAYCLSGTMADGTTVRDGSVANNALPLGTKITIRPSFYGRTRFTVRDRIGHGTDLDIWTGSCSTARAWGRRTLTMTVGWAVPVRLRAKKTGDTISSAPVDPAPMMPAQWATTTTGWTP